MPVSIVVENDKLPKLVERTGRYALEREMLASPNHALTAINKAKELFIEGIRKVRGFEFYPTGYGKDGFKYEGPLHHIEFSYDLSDDLGPVNMPDLPVPIGGEVSEDRIRNWREAMEKWSSAENARAAVKIGSRQRHLLDFRLHAQFITVGLPYFTPAGKPDVILGGKGRTLLSTPITRSAKP